MRIDGTRLDLRTMADCGVRIPHFLIGGRRQVQVLRDQVRISQVAPASEAGIGIGFPPLEYTIFCAPTGLAETVPRDSESVIDRDGWLEVTSLSPLHCYWLELRSFGGVSVEREDSDGVRNRWYWPLPIDLWREIQCG